MEFCLNCYQSAVYGHHIQQSAHVLLEPSYRTPSPYLEERLKLKELFLEFDDGRNCERVVAAIKELLLGVKDYNSEFAYETLMRTDQQ